MTLACGGRSDLLLEVGGLEDAGTGVARSEPDAGGQPLADASSSAADSAITEGTKDADEPADGADHADTSGAGMAELAPCSAGQDVFYESVLGVTGALPIGKQTYTNLDSTWYVPGPELVVDVTTSSRLVERLAVATPDGAPLTPGTYVQGSRAEGPVVSIAVGTASCSVLSGTLGVADITYAEGMPASFVLWFDVTCAGGPDVDGPATLDGCVRYER